LRCSSSRDLWVQITFSQTPEPWVQPWAPPASSCASCSSVGHWVGLWPNGPSLGQSPSIHLAFPAAPLPLPPSCLDLSIPSFCPTEQNEIIERKGCLPRAQCPLRGHATYWSRSYALRHHCCEQDLCNTATTLRPLHSPLLATLLLLVASFTWGGPLLRWLQANLQPSTQDSAPLFTAIKTPASEIIPRT
ncbi:unnamed protein product, partial [Gulo gulo]